MTVVLVHGNPETDAIWDPLVAALGRSDVVRLSPPGFGAPLPADFEPTHTGYRDWLAGELGRFDAPVDMVGHDWGGGHVVNVLLQQPELVRSWATDVIGLFDPDYTWHDMAKVWQTPGAGEELIDSMIGGPVEQRAETLVALGFPPETAAVVAVGQTPEMGRAILTLYRSAPETTLAEVAALLPAAAARPGLALLATDDPYLGEQSTIRRAAQRAGARVEVLDGLGHWWMLQDPQRSAQALTRFWASLT